MPYENTTQELNLAALASTPIDELLAVLLQRARATEPVAPNADQLARYVLAETVRLIRRGTRGELADAADALSHLLTTGDGEELAQRHPRAYRALDSAADVIVVAASPASRGGELAVLRAYEGRALALVWHVDRAQARALPRAQLLELLGVKDSYLSHILAELELAGLIERIRDGRNVAVHLGPRGYTEEVQKLLRDTPIDEVVALSASAGADELGRVLRTPDMLRTIEASKVITNVWMLTPDLVPDVTDRRVAEVVTTNLRRGVRYVYFVPPEVAVNKEMIDRLHTNLSMAGSELAATKELVSIVPLTCEAATFSKLGTGGDCILYFDGSTEVGHGYAYEQIRIASGQIQIGSEFEDRVWRCLPDAERDEVTRELHEDMQLAGHCAAD